MQAILHIGDMKCGSKSIQGWLAANESLLRGQGFHRCSVTRHSIYDSGLACSALDDADLTSEPRREHAIQATADVLRYRRSLEAGLAAEVAALPADAQAMLFSHEMLLSLQPPEVDRLMGLLRRQFSAVRVVAYLRRQDRLFLSLWGQRLKTHDPGGTFCDDLLAHRSYLRMLETWERAVGRENLSVRVFDRKACAGGDLLADFRFVAGIPDHSHYQLPAFRNESLDTASQNLLLHLRDRIQNPRDRARTRVVARLRRLLRLSGRARPGPIAFPAALSTFLWQHCTGSGVRPARGWAERIVAACAKENEEIRRRFCPDRPELFDREFSEYPPEGNPPGEGSTGCDPDSMRREPLAPPEPEHVAEAYRLVLGRTPSTSEVDSARRQTLNIAHLYATLLARSRAA